MIILVCYCGMKKNMTIEAELKKLNTIRILDRIIADGIPYIQWSFNYNYKSLLNVLYYIFHLKPWQIRTDSFEEYTIESAERYEDIILILPYENSNFYRREHCENISELMGWYRYHAVEKMTYTDNVHITWSIVKYSKNQNSTPKLCNISMK